MNQKEWEELTAQEKYEYISKTTWIVSCRGGLDGSKKVGDPNAVSNYYHVSAGDVQISHEYKDQQVAIKEALESCENYKLAAEEK